MRKSWLILSIISMSWFSLLGFGAGSENSYNSIRAAYYLFGEELPSGSADGYLKRAAAAQYNYLLAEFHLDTNEANPGIRPKKEEFRKAFLKAHDFGLRMIPKIQLGSKWSLHWEAAGNPNIQMNVYHDASRAWGCPSFAHDPDGIDASFEELLVVLKEAFDEAELPYELEFIDLGHDEPVDDGYLLIGGVHEIHAGPRDRFAQVDRDFIKKRMESYQEDLSTAIQALVVDELFRRAEQVHRIIGPETRILVYGDLWDPQANGGIEKKTFMAVDEEVCFDKDGREVDCTEAGVLRSSSRPRVLTSKMTPGIAELPGLSEEQKVVFRNSIVLRPWCYYDSWPFGGDPDGNGSYDAENSFSYFSQHGLKFIYTSVHWERPDDTDYTEGEGRAMRKFVRASRLFRQNCLGYAAAPWETRWQEPPATPPIFDTLEELYELNRDHIPGAK